MNETMTAVQCYLHQWTKINREQHPDRVDFEPAGTDWSNRRKRLAVPAGWTVSDSQQGTRELYDQEGRHVTVVAIANHLKSVQVYSSDGLRWFALEDDR